MVMIEEMMIEEIIETIETIEIEEMIGEMMN